MKRECRVTNGAYVRKESDRWVRYSHNKNSVIVVNEREWEKLKSQLELIREIEEEGQREGQPEGEQKKDVMAKIKTTNVTEEIDEEDSDEKELFVSDLRNMLVQKGSWFHLPTGEKVQGEEAAIELLKQRIEEGAV